MKFTALRKLIPFYILLIGLLPGLFLSKGVVVLTVNKLHTAAADYFFANISNLGDGIFIPIILLLLLFGYRLKFTYQFALSAFIQILVVLLFKELLFPDLERPYFFFKNIRDTLHFVDGVKIRYVNSFPSGHTATIFFITSYFALVIKKKHTFIPIFLALLAITVGFSRIYLVQHFFADVYFGMLFGLISSVAAFLIVRKYPQSWYKKRVIVHSPKVPSPIKRRLTNFHLW